MAIFPQTAITVNKTEIFGWLGLFYLVDTAHWLARPCIVTETQSQYNPLGMVFAFFVVKNRWVGSPKKEVQSCRTNAKNPKWTKDKKKDKKKDTSRSQKQSRAQGPPGFCRRSFPLGIYVDAGTRYGSSTKVNFIDSVARSRASFF
jgi:hypothetical protein